MRTIENWLELFKILKEYSSFFYNNLIIRKYKIKFSERFK